MGFVTPALLGGALLIGVPIVLHLIMRREVQHLVFPALRFVQQRKSSQPTPAALAAAAPLGPALRGDLPAGVRACPADAARLRRHRQGRQPDRRRAGVRQLAADDVPAREPDAARKGPRAGSAGCSSSCRADAPVTVIDRASRYGGRESDKGSAELRIERLDASSVVRPLEDALARRGRLAQAANRSPRRSLRVHRSRRAPTGRDDALAAFKARLDELPGAERLPHRRRRRKATQPRARRAAACRTRNSHPAASCRSTPICPSSAKAAADATN